MAHKEQIDFMSLVKERFPKSFDGVRVLDIGSLDINGNNRYLFTNYSYIGVDLGEGANVDVVCKGHEYKNEVLFDTVISTECFEHDEFWEKTIINCIALLKAGGLFAFTCATTGRAVHGVIGPTSWCSPFTLNYYRNLTETDMRAKIDFDKLFSEYQFSINVPAADLYFYGVKE
jgi:SAM-dependent methyltransferase